MLNGTVRERLTPEEGREEAGNARSTARRDLCTVPSRHRKHAKSKDNDAKANMAADRLDETKSLIG